MSDRAAHGGFLRARIARKHSLSVRLGRAPSAQDNGKVRMVTIQPQLLCEVRTEKRPASPASATDHQSPRLSDECGSDLPKGHATRPLQQPAVGAAQRCPTATSGARGELPRAERASLRATRAAATATGSREG